MTTQAKPHPGFQNSETSGCTVIFYSRGSDPLVYSSGAFLTDGRYRTDKNHSLISVTTNKGLEGMGTWSITLKPGRGTTETIFQQIVDDDWVDIEFFRHGKRWHTIRGLVSSVRRNRSVGGSGATSWTYVISGQDFQKIFDVTNLQFDTLVGENVGDGWSLNVFSVLPIMAGLNPADMVKKTLLGWYKELEGVGRANWELPDTIPNTTKKFITDIELNFNTSMFTNVPARLASAPNLLCPSGNLWTAAKAWSDSSFCELWCDLGRFKTPKSGSDYLQPDEELTVDQSTISVFFRDRPFPLSSSLVDGTGAKPPSDLGIGLESAWFKLPTHIVPRQQIQMDDIGRAGDERLNAFYVSPQMLQEYYGTKQDLETPLWDKDDILVHGRRRYDVASPYTAIASADLFTLTTLQRGMMMNWYGINPYLLNGTMALGVGRPDIRVGTRVRIPGDSGETSEDETYYVENVSNAWVFGRGTRTTLGVTRGYIGTDDEYLRNLDKIASRYTVAKVLEAQQIQNEGTP